jgi:hypothetical protein
VEQFFGIRPPAATQGTVRAQVTMDDRDLLSFIIFVCYYLTPGAVGLVRRETRIAFADENLMQNALLDEFGISPSVEQGSYCPGRNVLYRGTECSQISSSWPTNKSLVF